MRILSSYLSYEEQRKILYQGKNTASPYTAERMHSKLSKSYYDENEKERVIDVLVANGFAKWKEGELLFVESKQGDDSSLVREFVSNQLFNLISLVISLSILGLSIISDDFKEFSYALAYVAYAFTGIEAAIMITIPLTYFLVFYVVRFFLNGIYTLTMNNRVKKS